MVCCQEQCTSKSSDTDWQASWYVVYIFKKMICGGDPLHRDFHWPKLKENMYMGVLHKIIHISKLDNKFIILQIDLHNLNILMDYQ